MPRQYVPRQTGVYEDLRTPGTYLLVPKNQTEELVELEVPTCNAEGHIGSNYDDGYYYVTPASAFGALIKKL